MTDDEFEAACISLMDLIEADGSSANITRRTLSIDLHDEQVAGLVAALRPAPSTLRRVSVDFNGLTDGVVRAVEPIGLKVGDRVLAVEEPGYSCEGVVAACTCVLTRDGYWKLLVEIAIDLRTWREDI